MKRRLVFALGSRSAALVALGAVGGALGCGAEPEQAGWLSSQSEPVVAPLAAAYCEIEVEGQGSIDTETDYLPHVIQCENGGANLEALKAQAIAARSVAYYNMATSGSICDSQGCQVYSCGRPPTELAYRAVQETAGMYLSYNKMLTYGFYVAGDKDASAPSCIGSAGSTEKWVTYNRGKSGDHVEQTALGWVGPPGFGQNRGCMSQWGARCLENSLAYNYEEILQFFYGDDIQIITAPGACVDNTEPEEPGPEEPEEPGPEEPQPPGFSARLVASEISALPSGASFPSHRVCQGEPLDIELEFQNKGEITWKNIEGNEPGERVFLSAPQAAPDPFFGEPQFSLKHSSNSLVNPTGGECTELGCAHTRFELSGVAPSAPGIYITEWQLFDEVAGWFGPAASFSVEVVDCEGTPPGGVGGSTSAEPETSKPAQPNQSSGATASCSCELIGGSPIRGSGEQLPWLLSSLIGVAFLRRKYMRRASRG